MLFFGAAARLAFTDLCGRALHVGPNDRIALTVAGMSARLGAVVRAPITSILIVFEMTHQFAFVPLLIMPALSFASLQNRPVSTIANFSPVFAESTSPLNLNDYAVKLPISNSLL